MNTIGIEKIESYKQYLVEEEKAKTTIEKYESYTDEGVLAVLTFKVLEDALPGQAFIQLDYDQENRFRYSLYKR